MSTRAIILAAGESRRFKDAGYSTPKPFLQVSWRGTNQSMLGHVLNTIPRDMQVAIAVPKGYGNSQPGCVCHEIESTRGPAETAYQVLDLYGYSNPILFVDVDILNETNDLHKLSTLKNCGVLVKRSANPAYSYVDALGTFHHIAEKQRISDYAVQGAYFVPQHAVRNVMEEMERVIKEAHEPYMSHVFDRLTLVKYSIHTTYTPVDWGTPNDLKLSGAQICT